MLNLTRKVGEEIVIDYYGELITVRVLEFDPRHPREVRLGIVAPRRIPIARSELKDQ